VIYITPWSIRYLRRIGLNVKDQNKKGKPLVPISGGMAVLSGLFVGLMLFIFLQTFFPDGIILKDKSLVYLLSGLISIIMITFIGFIDDLMIRDDREVSLGLRQWQKPLLTFTAAIPLMVVHAGVSTLITFLWKSRYGFNLSFTFNPFGSYWGC
jgi:UDP-N-acetylmuramyl pentapeptide phosphotransferase/UDP-N-acetylglucosamine-1-phosphate transferase